MAFTTSLSSSQLGAVSGGADVLSGLLKDDDPTDKGSLGKAALSGAAKGAAAGLAFGPWGAAIGGVIGGVSGFFKGKKAKKEALAEEAQQQTMDTIAKGMIKRQREQRAEEKKKGDWANTLAKSQFAYEQSGAVSQQPAYGQPVFDPAQYKKMGALSGAYPGEEVGLPYQGTKG